MLEMQSDLVRRMALQKASAEAKSTGVMLRNSESILDQANALRNRPHIINKRKIPWVTVISLLFCAPLFLSEGSIPEKLKNPNTQHVVHSAGSEEMATVTVTMNGQTISREIPANLLPEYNQE